jgi:hypothetical protein
MAFRFVCHCDGEPIGVNPWVTGSVALQIAQDMANDFGYDVDIEVACENRWIYQTTVSTQ